MKKHKYTQALRIPREYNEEWVDLIKGLDLIMNPQTHREIRKVIGDSIRDVLIASGNIDKDCVVGVGKNKNKEDDGLVVVVFETATNLNSKGYIEIKDGDAFFYEEESSND